MDASTFEMFRSVGTLRYSPKSRCERNSTKWWLILDTCEGLAAYYRTQWNKHYLSRGWKLIKPAWTSHISVVRNEEPPIRDAWEKYAGKEIEFEYDTKVLGTGEYYWLDVRCEALLDIRAEMGLPRDPEYPLHLTVGLMQ